MSHLARDAVHMPFGGLKRKAPKLHLEVTYHRVGEEEVKAAERGGDGQDDPQEVILCVAAAEFLASGPSTACSDVLSCW